MIGGEGLIGEQQGGSTTIGPIAVAGAAATLVGTARSPRTPAVSITVEKTAFFITYLPIYEGTLIQ